MHGTALNIVNQTSVGGSLKSCLESAYTDNRLAFGVFECAQLLENEPDRAMVVLLPGDVDCDDVTVRLQTTLVEAFCWEYDIRLLKIGNTKDISRLLTQCGQANDTKALKMVKNADCNCILIECPDESDDFSEHDIDVLKYCNVTRDLLPQPIVTLPSD